MHVFTTRARARGRTHVRSVRHLCAACGGRAMMPALQLLGAAAIVIGLVGTWLAGRQRVGWLVCIVSSMLWVPTLVTGDQWAAIANCGVSVAICAHNFRSGHESRSPGQPCGDQAQVAEGKGFEPLMSLHS
jgi:hypothetical protein